MKTSTILYKTLTRALSITRPHDTMCRPQVQKDPNQPPLMQLVENLPPQLENAARPRPPCPPRPAPPPARPTPSRRRQACELGAPLRAGAHHQVLLSRGVPALQDRSHLPLLHRRAAGARGARVPPSPTASPRGVPLAERPPASAPRSRVERCAHAQPLNNFRMIERHYFKGRLQHSYDFNFGFVIPGARATLILDAQRPPAAPPLQRTGPARAGGC